jgi:hypothetical protein
MHIQAVQLAEPIEAPLGGGDVGERADSLELPDSGHFKRHDSRPDHQPERVPSDELAGERRKQGLVGSQELGPSLAQHIGADDTQRAFGSSDADLQLEGGIHPRHARQAGDARIERLREAGPAAPHLQVRLARYGAHRGGEVLDRRAVDEVHAVAERYTEGDAHYGEHRAAARAAPAEDREEPQHAD